MRWKSLTDKTAATVPLITFFGPYFSFCFGIIIQAMSKGGFLTPKAIANRMKSKGLQKLRWYCQMCQKQCRDANGFKVPPIE